MRTNIEIDDDLMAEAARATGLKTKKAIVEAGLQRLVQGNRHARFLAARGKVDFLAGYDHKALRAGLPPAAQPTVAEATPARRRARP